VTLEIGAHARPHPGETACGDAHLVLAAGPLTVVALADGLGHGPLAAEAAARFCAHVRACREAAVAEILLRAAPALAGSRGCAAAVVRVDEDAGRLTFAGVGNIELRAFARLPFHPVCAPGVVGRPLRRVVAFAHLLSPGDLFILHSDGVSTRFELADPLAPAQRIAEGLVSTHGKAHDDASCIVLRLLAR
jgi:phosphoserine phosphatase RsbX